MWVDVVRISQDADLLRKTIRVCRHVLTPIQKAVQENDLDHYFEEAHGLVPRGENKALLFQSHLEARWAAFFELAGWTWKYRPIRLADWTPTFIVSFSCEHSECHGSHTLAVEVQPFADLETFRSEKGGYYGTLEDYYFYGQNELPAHAVALFGLNPGVASWEMAHGAGGGTCDIAWAIQQDWEPLWKQTETEFNISKVNSVRLGSTAENKTQFVLRKCEI